MSSETESTKTGAHRPRWIIVIVMVLGLCLTLIFVVRAARSFTRLRHMQMRPSASNVNDLRGWMTIPHIARMYRVPEDVLFEALGLPAGDTYRNRSLYDINQEFFPNQPRLGLEKVKNAILGYYAAHPEAPLRPGAPSMPTLIPKPENGPMGTPPQAPKPSSEILKPGNQGTLEGWYCEKCFGERLV